MSPSTFRAKHIFLNSFRSFSKLFLKIAGRCVIDIPRGSQPAIPILLFPISRDKTEHGLGCIIYIFSILNVEGKSGCCCCKFPTRVDKSSVSKDFNLDPFCLFHILLPRRTLSSLISQ